MEASKSSEKLILLPRLLEEMNFLMSQEEERKKALAKALENSMQEQVKDGVIRVIDSGQLTFYSTSVKTGFPVGTILSPKNALLSKPPEASPGGTQASVAKPSSP